MKRFLLILMAFCAVTMASAQDSLNVMRVGELFLPDDNVFDVAVMGNYALLANGGGFPDYNDWCLRIIDVSNPAHPLRVCNYRLPQFPTDVAVSGNIAFVTTYGYGLRILNLADPLNPLEIGVYDAFPRPLAIILNGDLAYLAAGRNLEILDISNPENPSEVGFFPTPGVVECVAISGNRAYVAGWDMGLRVVDISDPAMPLEIGSLDTVTLVSSIAAAGNMAYIVTGPWQPSSYLMAVDFTDPAAPTQIGFRLLPGYCIGITLSDNIAYVSSADSGLRVIDISNPAQPVELGVYDRDTTGAHETEIIGNLAYTAFAGDGLRILDITNPATPTEMGFSCDPGWMYGVAISGNYAYVVSDYSRLYVADISNPSRPMEVAILRQGCAWDIAVSGHYAYTAGCGGLNVIDIAIPEQPSEVGFFETPYDFEKVVISGTYAYLLDPGDSLIIVDITDPVNPFQSAAYMEHGYVYDVAITENLAYLGCTDGLLILDVTEPYLPQEIALLDSIGAVINVSVSGGTACIRCGRYPFAVVDITDPQNPTVLGSYAISSLWIENISHAGNYAYVARERLGLQVINITDPHNIVESGHYVTSNRAFDVALYGNLVVVVGRTHFGIYDCSAATGVSESFVPYPSSFNLSAYPNPFNASTRISFTLPRASRVELNVYDVTGRLAQNLASRTYDAGEHSLLFNGTELSSGVYFVRLKNGELAKTRKIVMVK